MSHPQPNRQTTLGKLSAPRLGRVIRRERLFADIDQFSSAPGLWIAGPPGIGKSTLVATYLDARTLPCLWLQLDAGDADPATFVHFLRTAAKRLTKRRQLHLPLPNADDLRDVPGFIRRCFRHLSLALDLPWVLVLDNLQELGAGSPLHAGISAALTELPREARLIVISRDPPGPNYARALANQQLVLIDAAAMRFNDDETGQLVQLHDRDWAPADLRAATDGWAAAMILMLAARRDWDDTASMQGGTARDRLFAFFAGEVLEKMAPSASESLMRIAFLPRATAAMAVAITGNPDAAELLADLAHRSLFTDHRAGSVPAFTFHALFGEFLRARAADTLTTESLRSLRLLAAQVLLANDQADAAMMQLIEAQAWDAALSLLITQAGPLVAEGRTATVRGWILALPEAQRSGPQASYWLGYCEMATDPSRALQHFERAHRDYVATGDERGAFFVASAAADAIVFQGTTLDALAFWLPALEHYAPIYLADHDTETDLRVLPGLLATFVYRETGHPLTAPLAELAERLLDQPLAASQRILLGSLAYYLLWTGQSERLDRVMLKIDRLCLGQDAAPATLLRWCGVGVIVRSLRGNVDEALQQARSAIALTDQGLAPLRAKAELLLVLAALAARDANLARTHLTEAAAVMDPSNLIDATTYQFQHGLVLMLEGDLQGAAQLMRASVVSSAESGWPMREHVALLGLTLTLTRMDAFHEAQATLQAVKAHRFYASCRWHQWLAALIESYLAERRGDRANCLLALASAFKLGRDNGYNFGPMPYCCGDMMSRLASLALDNNMDAPFALNIIRRYALPAPADAGPSWPWPVRIHTLGRFAIECDGAPAPSGRKESRKPLDLLKLLVALGGGAAPVNRLCAALWPEAQGDAARNSFDNALHRLRKLLGADHHLQLGSGTLSLNKASCWTDLGALETCLATAESVGQSATAAPTLALINQVMTLYQGEFLAGEEELPDVLVARNRIQARVTRQLCKLAAALEADGQHAAAVLIYQRIVEQQPLAEEVYRRLIACLLIVGQPAEAFDAYRRCRQQLSVVLGMRPAPETDALVASLRNL